MKNITFVLLLSLLFIGCSSDDNENANYKIKEIFNSHNLNPTNVEQITYVEVSTHNGSKIAMGQRNNNAWLSKFDNDGNEIYSKEYPFSFNGVSKSFFRFSTTTEIMEALISTANQIVTSFSPMLI